MAELAALDAEITVPSVWAPSFPSAAEVARAAAAFPHRDSHLPLPWLELDAAQCIAPRAPEGPRPRITIGPGVVILSRPDLAKAERTAQREHEHHVKDADVIGAYIAEEDHLPPDRPSRVIADWSGKSRANMVKTFASLDFGPLIALGRVPGLTTVTYPGDWLTVAPDGKTAKKQLATLRKRFARAWGEPLIGLWKLEFQERGAPHFHLYHVPPWGLAGDARRARYEADLIAWEVSGQVGRRPRFRVALGDGLPFRQWLSLVWADILGHPDPEEYRKNLASGTNVDVREGMRCSDPRRLAVYFSKHGQYRAKDYQNDVPEEWQEPGKGPGRFWGYWGLEKAVVSVELSARDYNVAVRTARRYARSKGLLREPRVPRSNRGEINPAFVRHDPQETSDGRVCMGAAGLQLTEGKVRRRKVTRRAKYLSQGAGFLCVNDGPGLALQLARVITGNGDVMSKKNSRQAKAARRAVRVPRQGPMDWTYELDDMEREGILPRVLLVAHDGTGGDQRPFDPHRDMADLYTLKPGVYVRVVWKCECGFPGCDDWWVFETGLGGSLRAAVPEARRAGRLLMGDRRVYDGIPESASDVPGLGVMTDSVTAAMIEGRW